MANKFIILDRDGTLIKHIHHLVDFNLVETVTNLAESLQIFKTLGFEFGVISNQSVVGRGLATFEEVNKINNLIVSELDTYGIKLSFFLICPHLPENNCDCRKPATGLGVLAIEKYNIDCATSFMLGDKETDTQFGKALGLKTIQISKNLCTQSENADFYARDILAAAKWVQAQLIISDHRL